MLSTFGCVQQIILLGFNPFASLQHSVLCRDVCKTSTHTNYTRGYYENVLQNYLNKRAQKVNPNIWTLLLCANFFCPIKVHLNRLTLFQWTLLPEQTDFSTVFSFPIYTFEEGTRTENVKEARHSRSQDSPYFLSKNAPREAHSCI